MGLAPIIGDTPEDDYADALHSFVVNPALRQKLGAANRAYAVATLDETAMIAAYKNVYNGALKRSHRATSLL